MSIARILGEKNSEVHTCRSDWPLMKCIRLMNERKIGALVVTDEFRQVEGIVSERDVLRFIDDRNGVPGTATAGEAMTGKEKLVTVPAEESVEQVMDIMTKKRIRHIPVIEEEKLAGIVSIGDVVKFMLDSALLENNALKNYISGS